MVLFLFFGLSGLWDWCSLDKDKFTKTNARQLVFNSWKHCGIGFIPVPWVQWSFELV